MCRPGTGDEVGAGAGCASNAGVAQRQAQSTETYASPLLLGIPAQADLSQALVPWQWQRKPKRQKNGDAGAALPNQQGRSGAAAGSACWSTGNSRAQTWLGLETCLAHAPCKLHVLRVAESVSTRCHVQGPEDNELNIAVLNIAVQYPPGLHLGRFSAGHCRAAAHQAATPLHKSQSPWCTVAQQAWLPAQPSGLPHQLTLPNQRCGPLGTGTAAPCRFQG